MLFFILNKHHFDIYIIIFDYNFLHHFLKNQSISSVFLISMMLHP
jgi:hypothetical protein